ncbi:MAG: 3-deoxy-manno-octulosonate cytidylyltransferase [Rhodospirillales bacterium 12-54-5]|nr:MAG: 3-deoxy-manno-octulosonate cytidylyltransferase [Rhodospirillales bacterium 12-54-5]
MALGGMKTLIVIPARLAATRLPNKPMAMIGDAPMIVHVWRRAFEAAVGEVIVACDGEEIAGAVRAAGGLAVITDPNHPSGSDRIWEAVRDKHADIIINLQGDVPTLEPRLLRAILAPLANPAVDIATLVAPITRTEEHSAPSVVKVAMALTPDASSGRALYFSRAPIPANDGTRYHHIGVYAYRRAALEQFVALPPSPLELREKLEQLRALEAGMRIDAVVVDTVPLGVDTHEDLERARALLA